VTNGASPFLAIKDALRLSLWFGMLGLPLPGAGLVPFVLELPAGRRETEALP